jgi:hypothetical protein
MERHARAQTGGLLRICAATLIVVALSAALAQPARTDGGSALTGAFADPEPGGRAAGLAGALAPIVDDPSALHWNPARLLHVAGSGIMATYADLFGLGLVRQGSLFLAYPRFERVVTWKDGQVRNRPGKVTTVYGLGIQSTTVDLDPESYSEHDLSLGLARRGYLGLEYGFVGHALFVRSDLTEVRASGYALDVALSRPITARINGSLVLRSLLSSLSWDGGTSERLCPRAQVGISGALLDGLRIPVVATYDFDRQSLIQVSGGAEWFIAAGALALRAGLRWRDDGAEAELHGAVGAGLCWKDIVFDYGLATGREALGDTHRLSLRFQF